MNGTGTLGVAVVGCGLIGSRRAEQAVRHPRSRLVVVCDSLPERAEELAGRHGCRAIADWRAALGEPGVDVVVVATPNGFLKEVGLAALEAGRHVLLEKPMGRNLAEAEALAAAARRAGRRLKIGFNHRYHPAIARAHVLFEAGEIGTLINLRARYGHGGRPGYENEWRGDPELAGGGELTDQGVHVADLVHWFAGLPEEAFAWLQTAAWPIAPLEDNGFGLFRFAGGAHAQFHTSWTQWKNLFSLEVFGSGGSLVVEGLGGSYGPERLTVAIRRPEGGVPEMREEVFDGPDPSWRLEWDEFVDAILDKRPYLGNPQEGVAAMRMIDALYRSAREGRVARV